MTVDFDIEQWFYSLPNEEKAQFIEDTVVSSDDTSRFAPYQYKPIEYIKDFLGWTPWSAQCAILEAYALALVHLHQRDDFENGRVMGVYNDKYPKWKPGEVIQNWISVDAGYNVGKTKIISGLISHYFDCFPSIVECFAPTHDQINLRLFKELREDRKVRIVDGVSYPVDKKGAVPGEVMLEPRIKLDGEQKYVQGRATNNSNSTGMEKIQGGHHPYLMFALDEAEAIPLFVWKAIRGMASGGKAIVISCRNPRTTSCEAQKIRKRPNVATFRISELEHPNVIEDREIIPGSVRRQYVQEMADTCEIVEEHNTDDYTFELPWNPGVIYKPTLEVKWMVLGVASSDTSDNTFCPTGRYEAAINRKPYDGDDPTFASIGADAARYGNDKGTIWTRHNGAVHLAKTIKKQDGYVYYLAIKKELLRLADLGVERVSIRIDGGGGWGSVAIDNLNRDIELNDPDNPLFEEFNVFEVHFGGRVSEPKKYYNLATEMYFYAGQSLKVLSITNPPPDLEVDICERTYKHYGVSKNKKHIDVKKIQTKEKFKEIYHRSPDYGDGFVLAVVADEIVKGATGFSMYSSN